MASAGRKRPSTHHTQARRNRTFTLDDLYAMKEEDYERLFRRMRWPETDGEPVCPNKDCASLDHWWLEKQKRWKCRGCYKQFSITSGSGFHHTKLPLSKILKALRTFILGSKGNATSTLMKDVGIQYKTAYLLQQKFREGLKACIDKIDLEGEIEIDGAWFGGYIKPENRKINRVDRRLKENQNGKRLVVVGARERGRHGRAITKVFEQEHQSIPWLRERLDRRGTVYSDEGQWDNLRASHQVLSVNHSEEYQRDGYINTNQMESLFSRLRRFEVGTHHHISGKYLALYACDGTWRENNRELDDRAKMEMALGCIMQASPSRTFGGYYQFGAANLFRAMDDNPFAGWLQ